MAAARYLSVIIGFPGDKMHVMQCVAGHDRALVESVLPVVAFVIVKVVARRIPKDADLLPRVMFGR